MHHDPGETRPLDPGRINASDPEELQYWCNELECTEPQLRDALVKVGNHVAEVRELLASRS
jgi:uncharacterized protein DUF3606